MRKYRRLRCPKARLPGSSPSGMCDGVCIDVTMASVPVVGSSATTTEKPIARKNFCRDSRRMFPVFSSAAEAASADVKPSSPRSSTSSVSVSLRLRSSLASRPSLSLSRLSEASDSCLISSAFRMLSSRSSRVSTAVSSSSRSIVSSRSISSSSVRSTSKSSSIESITSLAVWPSGISSVVPSASSRTAKISAATSASTVFFRDAIDSSLRPSSRRSSTASLTLSSTFLTI